MRGFILRQADGLAIASTHNVLLGLFSRVHTMKSKIQTCQLMQKLTKSQKRVRRDLEIKDSC